MQDHDLHVLVAEVVLASALAHNLLNQLVFALLFVFLGKLKVDDMEEKAVPGRVLAQHFQLPCLKVDVVVVLVFQVQCEIL